MDDAISFEDATKMATAPSDKISFEEALSHPSAARQIGSFMTGVGRVVPFGQDIPAALNVLRSYFPEDVPGSHPAGVPKDASMGERMEAAKRKQEEAYEVLGKEYPKTQAAGMTTGIVGSLSPLGRVAAGEQAISKIAGKVVPSILKPAAEVGTKIGTGATTGAVYGLGEGATPEERLSAAKSGAVAGSVLSGLPMLAEPTAKAFGAITSIPLWFKTGESFKSLNDAVSAGLDKSPSFWNHLVGNVTSEDLVNRTQNAINKIYDKRSSDYLSGMKGIKGVTDPLDYTKVDQAIFNQMPKAYHLGKIYNHEAANAIKEATDKVNVWKNQSNLPGAHSMEDFDKLKRSLDEIHYKYSKDFGAESPAAKSVSDIRKSVFETIKDKDPKYAETMEKYANTSKLLNEIKKEVTGGSNASVGSKLRKIMRARDDAHKGELISELAKIDPELPYAISGHELSATLPQGIRGIISNAIIGSGLYNIDPTALIGLALSSPKVAGALQYGIGRAGGIAKESPSSLKAVGIPLLAQPRDQRATGGSVSRGMTAKSLISAVESARKNIANQTKVILNQPDERVASALKVANNHI